METSSTTPSPLHPWKLDASNAFVSSIEELEDNISYLSAWPERNKDLVNTSRGIALSEPQTTAWTARQACSTLGEPEGLKDRIDSDLKSLDTARDDARKLFAKDSQLWIAKAAVTVLHNILSMKAATLKLDTEPPQQLDIAQMATFADSSNEVSKGEVAFKRAIQVLDLCTPDIGGEDAESTDPEIKLVRDALRERSEESQAKLAAFIGSDRRMSDQTLSDLRVYEEVHHTKQSLTESMEAVRRDWYPKVANILNKYRRMGEELLGKAITNGERFVTSSNAASDTMTLKAHQDRWQDSYNAVVEKTREIARLIQMSCSAHPSLGSDSVAEQNLELFEVIKKAKEAQ